MRIALFIITLVVTIVLIIVLNTPLASVPPLGRFLSPQQGFWQNAEPSTQKISESIQDPHLKGKVQVYFDDRLVPHVFADNEPDAYFVQGYLHAKYRLWQMEFQTHAAAGRMSEILGAGPEDAILQNDRKMRRIGMEFGARNSLKQMERDPQSRDNLNAYTAGVNSFINSISYSSLPLEYRLLNYYPEQWSNLKTALFLKYMSYDLTGGDNDIEYSNAKSVFTKEQMSQLYPLFHDSLEPIIPPNTMFQPASVSTSIPADADSLYFSWIDSVSVVTPKQERGKGSNNWAVSGTLTASGKPILCNDPHLGLNLPSLWYEMQITTPEYSAYGVSFPGSPSIIIGFNDSIAWGVTNAARDVKDYFRVQFKDESRQQYLFENEWKSTELKMEEYRIKGRPSFRDTVAYTMFGPVMYDESYDGTGRTKGYTNLAVRWKAHDPSNELKTFTLLNRARNYNDYVKALSHFVCPGQNFVFASKSNDIAIWQQGRFPLKWNMQGDFILPGTDSAYLWKGDIPILENPHTINPQRGFVSSANQLATDSSYPYYLGGQYDLYRGIILNRKLRNMTGITVTDMRKLQTDNYNVFAETALPIMLKNVNAATLSDSEREFLQKATNWNRTNDPDEEGATIFELWFAKLEDEVWKDEMEQVNGPFIYPEQFTLVEAMIADSAFRFIDNITTTQTESLTDVVTAAFKKAAPDLTKLLEEERLTWSKYKDSGIRHLLRLAALSRFHLRTGGGNNILNATKQFNGPSWKMVVHLTDNIEAYGIYPGGQSGNPGSRYYDMHVNKWAEGDYFPLWFMKQTEMSDQRVTGNLNFSRN
jgi:penicillin G amidase